MKRTLLSIVFLFILANVMGADEILIKLIQDKNNAVKLNDTNKIIDAYNDLGDYYSETGEFTKSDSTLNIGLKYAVFQKNDYQCGIINNLLASNASYQGNRPQAFVYYHRALKAFAEIKNADKVALILMNMGSEYEFAGNLTLAMAYKLKALKNKEISGVKKNLDYYYQNVGQLFKESDKDKWAYYVNKAYETSKTIPTSRYQTKVAIFNDLGGIAEAKKKYNDALVWYDSMLVVSQKNDYVNGLSTAYSNRSLLYKSTKQYNKALKDIEKAMELDKQLNRNYSIIVNKIHAGQILMELNRFAEAEKYLSGALEHAKLLKYYPEEEAIAHLELSKIGERTKNWKSAFEHYVLYETGIDSIRGEETQKTIHDLEIKYQTSEKEKKIVLLDKENKLKNLEINRTRMYIFTLIVVSLLVLAVVLFITTRNRLRQQKKQTELHQKLLRSQMNPHFMFNTLNAINQYIKSNEPDAASDYLAKYAKLMRQILEHSSVEFVPVDTEIDFLRNYLTMQQLRFSKGFDYDIFIAEDIDTENTDIPPMLAQPFIENAIEHGIRDMKGGGKILISIKKSNKNLILSVKDNGKGMEASDGTKNHKSFAIQITKERLKIHGFSEDAVQIESPDKETGVGTSVTIVIPFKTYS